MVMLMLMILMINMVVKYTFVSFVGDQFPYLVIWSPFVFLEIKGDAMTMDTTIWKSSAASRRLFSWDNAIMLAFGVWNMELQFASRNMDLLSAAVLFGRIRIITVGGSRTALLTKSGNNMQLALFSLTKNTAVSCTCAVPRSA